MKKINLEDLKKIEANSMGAASTGEVEETFSNEGSDGQGGTIKASSKQWDRTATSSSSSSPVSKE